MRAHYKSRRKQLVENLDSLKAGPAPPHLPALNWEPPKTLHNLLASELIALDKSAAPRLRKFSAAEMAQNTSRRKQLVEQLDSWKLITEDFSWPNNKPSHETQAEPSASHISQTDEGAPTTAAPPPEEKETAEEKEKAEEEEKDSDLNIPASEVAQALTNAFTIATRDMRFQTLGESRFAPKATATTYSKYKSAAAASASPFRSTFSTRAPAPSNTPAGGNLPTAVSEEDRARLFRERSRGRGIVVGGVKNVDAESKFDSGEKNVTGWKFEGGKRPTTTTTTREKEEQGAYASLGLFEEVVGRREQNEEREVLGPEQEQEERKGKGKGKEKEVLPSLEDDNTARDVPENKNEDDPEGKEEEKEKALATEPKGWFDGSMGWMEGYGGGGSGGW